MCEIFVDESERSLAETASIEEGVLYGSSVELRQSHKKISTLKRKSAGGALKPPPRPTPGSVTYTDDESDKAYDHNPDESSLTEKPSEISSSDSQVKNKTSAISLLSPLPSSIPYLPKIPSVFEVSKEQNSANGSEKRSETRISSPKNGGMLTRCWRSTSEKIGHLVAASCPALPNSNQFNSNKSSSINRVYPSSN